MADAALVRRHLPSDDAHAVQSMSYLRRGHDGSPERVLSKALELATLAAWRHVPSSPATRGAETLDVVMDRLPLDARSTGLLPFVALYPLVATVVITGLCLLLHRLLLRCGATALFSLPVVRAAPARARPAAMRSRPLGSPSRRARVH